MKGERIWIPATMRGYILKTIHAGHQGIEKCKLRAKTCVYWRGMDKDIELTVQSCAICQANQNSQQAETLIPHEIPDGPWQIVATDLFHLGGTDYIIIADYYSKMPFVRRLPSNITSTAVIAALKQLFGEHGIPHRLLSDNGPQYDCSEFRRFATDWGFQHATSSPRYPQSNGFAECMVQTVKRTMLKARQSRTDPDLALLCLRTTPLNNNLPAPAMLLYSRPLKSNLPFLPSPAPDQAIHKALEDRQRTQKKYFDRGARDLPPLHVNQQVQLQEADGTWTPATVVDRRSEPRSYTVSTPNGGLYRRNRRHLRDLTILPKSVSWAD